MSKDQTVAEAIAVAWRAYNTCLKYGNPEWETKWADRLAYLLENYLPSGSGFDARITLVEADEKRLVFDVPFHPMNSNGYYEEWVTSRVTVWPVWGGLDVKAHGAGSMHNEYIAESMAAFLLETAPKPDW